MFSRREVGLVLEMDSKLGKRKSSSSNNNKPAGPTKSGHRPAG